MFLALISQGKLLSNPMETEPSSPTTKYCNRRRAEVDTSRPFRSVKEAVEIFGELILAGDLHAYKGNINTRQETTPRPSTSSYASSLSNHKQEKEDKPMLNDSLMKLQSDLDDTKRELTLLKERESETEIALASLNAELHKNMCKLAEAEVLAAGQAASKSGRLVGGKKENEEKRVRFERSPSLAQALSSGEKEGYFGVPKKQKKMMKKKPIIPLITDMLPRRKTSFSISNPLHARTEAYIS